MACRQTGFALLCSNSVQEVHDLAAIAHAATLETRIPFLHFFDGFRTSHEVSKIEELSDDDLRSLIPESAVFAHRQRGLTPDRPVLRGTAQNLDVFFQAREAQNRFYDACADVVEQTMQRFATLTGRRYKLFDYVGDPNAERVIVLMGSGAETVHETVDYLVDQGEKVGVLKVRLYRLCFTVWGWLPDRIRAYRLTLPEPAYPQGAFIDPIVFLHSSYRLPGVVFSGSLDGHFRAYDSSSGKVLLDVNTINEYETTNSVPPRGGSINGPGATIAGGMGSSTPATARSASCRAVCFLRSQ